MLFFCYSSFVSLAQVPGSSNVTKIKDEEQPIARRSRIIKECSITDKIVSEYIHIYISILAVQITNLHRNLMRSFSSINNLLSNPGKHFSSIYSKKD